MLVTDVAADALRRNSAQQRIRPLNKLLLERLNLLLIKLKYQLSKTENIHHDHSACVRKRMADIGAAVDKQLFVGAVSVD